VVSALAGGAEASVLVVGVEGLAFWAAGDVGLDVAAELAVDAGDVQAVDRRSVG
jgi:hypothetical protein